MPWSAEPRLRGVERSTLSGVVGEHQQRGGHEPPEGENSCTPGLSALPDEGVRRAGAENTGADFAGDGNRFLFRRVDLGGSPAPRPLDTWRSARARVLEQARRTGIGGGSNEGQSDFKLRSA